MFDEEIINGSYFNYYDESYKNIESLIKNSKNLKSIWLNGFDYTGSLSQHSKDEKKPLEILLNNKKIFLMEKN